LCIYCVNKVNHSMSVFGTKHIGNHRQNFLEESLHNLDRSLQKLGNKLLLSPYSASQTFKDLLDDIPVTSFYRHRHPGVDESKTLESLKRQFNDVRFVIEDGLTLFDKKAIEFNTVPSTFSQFRRQVESFDPPNVIDKPYSLPASLDAFSFLFPASRFIVNKANIKPTRYFFSGGERAAHNQLDAYFSSNSPSSYKSVRNALEGWGNSTKFSAWLANGNLSPRQVLQSLTDYGNQHGANESTYWIYFELLWQEYFHLYAQYYGAKLFQPQGITGKSNKGRYYAERFQKWCNGNTPYPIVNACMNQLDQTGYISNRGRQLAASCLIHELGIDWRYGAALFEEKLIDYDVAINWGNWQYIAGVGADPKGGRHFNLEKQTQIYDPNGAFISKWQGDQFDRQLDSVDAADWPIQIL